MKQKGKIYLLIGYLGSGKTSFIRNLLQNKQSQKYAVIQNEFAQGQMGIEQPLIMNESGIPFSSFLELPNGCICCSAKNDLVAGVQYILNNTDVQNIIVETNGLADPAEAIKQFWFDQKMEMNASLHSIITLIAVPKYEALQRDQLFQKQVVYANKVLLTFIDKSTHDQVNQVQSAVNSTNPQCQIAKNNNYNIVNFMSGNDMFDFKSLLLINKQLKHQQHSHSQLNINKHGTIKSIFIKGRSKYAKKSQFECAIGFMLWEANLKILRIKGLICLEDNLNAYQLQGVQDIFQIKETQISKLQLNNQIIILVIGQNLKENQLKQILKIN